jgi:hypothetical protein
VPLARRSLPPTICGVAASVVGGGQARQILIAIRGYYYRVVRERIEIASVHMATNLANQAANIQGLPITIFQVDWVFD